VNITLKINNTVESDLINVKEKEIKPICESMIHGLLHYTMKKHPYEKVMVN
jgi:translation initiation factor IF-3